MTRDANDDRFLLAGGAVGVLGCLLVIATPLAAGASTAFTGSIVTSGLLGLAFAVRNLQLSGAPGRSRSRPPC